MANKLSAAIGNIVTALGDLVDDGALRGVQRRLINPLTVADPPQLTVLISRLQRQDRIWDAELLLQLVVRSGEDVDEATLDEALDLHKMARGSAPTG